MKKIKKKYIRVISKEDLYFEFLNNSVSYASASDLYWNYYHKLEVQKIGKTKANYKKVVNPNRVPPQFHVMVKGFKARRDKDLKAKQEELIKQQAINESKRSREIELKNDFLNPSPYLEQFKFTRDIVDYALKRITLKIANALNKIKHIQNLIIEGKYLDNFDDELPSITLTENELRQLYAYKSLFETARTTMKLPMRYNANIEDDNTKGSIGELLQAVQEYSRQGGKVTDEKGKEIPILEVEFKRHD